MNILDENTRNERYNFLMIFLIIVLGVIAIFAASVLEFIFPSFTDIPYFKKYYKMVNFIKIKTKNTIKW